ncbi:MAG TPA: ribosome maturation factor RimM [Gemmatimonadaceae bacterium]|nr:ribosome maturation factor RimM [Gemmatimonadaceae bacterium]
MMIVGRLLRAHGIRGELIVEPITSEPAAVFAVGRRLFAGDSDGDPLPGELVLTVRTARERPNGTLIVLFDEIDDRTEAERWQNRHLLAPASELTPPGEGEVYVHELVGMRALLEDGGVIGEVTGVLELPQGLALEIERSGAPVILPFHEAFIRRVDREGRSIVVAPPEGLLD